MAEVQPALVDPVAGLVDIPLPPAVSLWPQTWTLRIAIALLIACAAIGLWRFIHRWRASRYRREALAELDRIGCDKGAGEDREQLAALSLLVRRTALAAFPREAVAPLAGGAWLAFLDRSYGGQGFSQGAGRLLASAPYRCEPPDGSELRSLAELVRQWIRVHHA